MRYAYTSIEQKMIHVPNLVPRAFPLKKVEKTNHAQWAKGKNRASLSTCRILLDLICNFCHNLISRDKNAFKGKALGTRLNYKAFLSLEIKL